MRKHEDVFGDVPRPGVGRACFLIALDNGGINRDRSEKRWKKDYTRWIERQTIPNLIEIDNWLFDLTEESLNLVCCGGQDEPETIAVMQSAPMFTNTLLNDYFDEVC